MAGENKFSLNKMPQVKTTQVDETDKSEAWDSANEKTSSKYLYNPKTGKKVSVDEAYTGTGKKKTIKPQYKDFVTDTIAGKKTGSGNTAKKVVEDVKDAIKNGQERNAVRADYSEASPDVKESLAKNTKASQKVIDKQVESIKKGEGFEGSKKVLTDTEEGKAFTSGEEIKPEDNFKQVEAITSDPNVEKAIADTGLSIDNAPEDPSLAGEVASSELQKAGLDKDTVNSLMGAFAGAFTGKVDKEKDVKSELASVLANKKEQLDELSKTGMGSKIAGILTVLSAVACLATGGVIPPINFNTVSAIINDPHGYIRGNKEHAIEEKRKDIESANEAVREAEKKDITYKTDKDLVKQIMAENPGMTEEDAWQMLKNRTRQSVNVSAEQVSKDADLARDFVSRNFTTGDDALRIASEYDAKALEYEKAAQEVKSAPAKRKAELYASYVPLLGQLQTSFSSGSTSSGMAVNPNTNLNLGVFSIGGGGGYNSSEAVSSGTNSMSREGLQVGIDEYNKLQQEVGDVDKILYDDLMKAANVCKQIANEYRAQAKQTSEQFSADKVTSDIRKKLMKHTYIPKEKRLH